MYTFVEHHIPHDTTGLTIIIWAIWSKAFGESWNAAWSHFISIQVSRVLIQKL